MVCCFSLKSNGAYFISFTGVSAQAEEKKETCKSLIQYGFF